MRERRGAHDPGRVVRDLTVMLASGGSHLSDLRAVRDQEPLLGAVASDATAWRTIEAIARDPELLVALRGARREAREGAWAAGAQLSITDSGGHRFQAILTDRAGDAAELERDHRARCEDRIRCSKQMGLELLPFGDFEMNAVWMELVLIAGALVAWADLLVLRGELSGLEPKRLRYRALHTAGRLGFHARRATLRLERRWPWAEELAAAFAGLRQLPVPAG